MRKTEGKNHGTISSSPEVVPYETLEQERQTQADGRPSSHRLPFVKCANPYVTRGLAFGCGQCMACRVNRRRVWTHRIILEAKEYEFNTFATLTYSDDHVPALGSLEPEHLKLFMYRLRFALKPQKIRFYAVGEYGDDTERPHYHVAFFGLENCLRGRTMVRRNGICCESCSRVASHWSYGNVYLGELNSTTAAYIAGYCTKKLTARDDERLHGRHPEFARMSNRPGIGAHAMDDVASTLMEHGLDKSEDVPAALRHGGRLYPLGRYLRRRLRTRIGRDEKAPESVLEKARGELRPLRDLAYGYAPVGSRLFAFKNEVIKSGEGKRARLESLGRIHKKRVSI